MENERKTMSADKIRKQLTISKQAMANYLALGVLAPVPDTINSDTPLYYTDEVASISEALKACDYNIKRLNAMRGQVQKELLKTKYASRLLELNASVQDKVTTDFIDAVALFMDKALPKLDKCKSPFYDIQWENSSWFNEAIRHMAEGRYNHKTPQEFCEDLRHEVEVIDATSLLNCVKERDALIEERDELSKQINELKQKLELLAPQSLGKLARNGYKRELNEVQVQGLKKKLSDCNFSTRLFLHLKDSSLFDKDKELTLFDIVQCTKDEIKSIRNLGKTTISELHQMLYKYHLDLGMDIIEINGKYYCK